MRVIRMWEHQIWWENEVKYDFIEDSVKALREEIQKLKEDGGREILLFDGEFHGKDGNEYIYSFNLEEELYLMDDAPVKVRCSTIAAEGVAIHCQGFEILLALNDYLEHPLKRAILQTEPWNLLEALQDRLRELPGKKTFSLVQSVVKLARSCPMTDEFISQGQTKAIRKALRNPITFIWGPPGTGKTYTLAQIALESFQKGEKVLILSHANIAVDGAIEAIAKQIPEQMMHGLLEENQVFPIVRYGYSRSDFLRNHECFSSYKQALGRVPHIADRIKELEEMVKDTGKDFQTKSYRKELRELRRQVKEIEKNEIIPKTKVVGTTVSKAQIDPAIYEKSFDVVLLDEASMAYIPQSLYAAGLAGKRVVYIGDFKQLAPIAMADGTLVDTWLKRDIFEFTRVKQQVDGGSFPLHLAMLNEQRRMHPGISGFVTVNIYDRLLRDHDSVEDDRPWNQVLKLMDTGQMFSIAMKDRNQSRFNVLHAFLSTIIALQYSQELAGSVGIITPYSAQSKLINNILKDIFGNQKWPVSAATVHRFQGSERDTIVFDTVDSFRLRIPGVLLTGSNMEQDQRLINVAVTRAKRQLITIANTCYWDDRRLSRGKILRKLLDYLQDKGGRYNFMENCEKSHEHFNHLRHNKFRIDFHRNFNGAGMDELLSRVVKDITEGEKIYISCPAGGELTRKSLEEVFNQVPNLQNKKIIIRAEDKKQLPPALMGFAEQRSVAWLPLLIVDKKIIHYGFPFCIDGQVNDVLLIRFDGEATADFLAAQLDFDDDAGSLLDNTVSESFREFVEKGIRCSKCKLPMTVKKNRKTGRYFIGCSGYPSCRNIHPEWWSILQIYLQQYPIYCDSCGGTMVVKSGRKGIFIGCSNYRGGCRNTAEVGSVC